MRRGGGKIGTKSCKERHEAAAAAALGVGCTSVLLSSFYRPILHHQHQVMNVSNISQTKIRVKEREGL